MTARSAARSAPPPCRAPIVLDPMLRAVADIAWDYADGHAADRAQRAARPARGRRFGRRAADRAGADRAARVRFSSSATSSSSSTTSSAARIPAFCSTATARPRRSSITGSSAATISASLVPQVREAIRGQIVRRLLPADRALLPVLGDADGSLHRRLLRQRDRRSFLSAPRQRQCRRAAPPLCRHHQPQQRLRRLRSGFSRIRPPHLSRAAWRRHRIFLRRAASGDAGDARRRYAFLAFLYGEADAALREANNAKMHAKRIPLCRESDRLFPEEAERPLDTPRRLTTRRLVIADFPANIATLLGMESPCRSPTSGLMTPTGRFGVGRSMSSSPHASSAVRGQSRSLASALARGPSEELMT